MPFKDKVSTNRVETEGVYEPNTLRVKRYMNRLCRVSRIKRLINNDCTRCTSASSTLEVIERLFNSVTTIANGAD